MRVGHVAPAAAAAALAVAMSSGAADGRFSAAALAQAGAYDRVHVVAARIEAFGTTPGARRTPWITVEASVLWSEPPLDGTRISTVQSGGGGEGWLEPGALYVLQVGARLGPPVALAVLDRLPVGDADPVAAAQAAAARHTNLPGR